MKPSHPNCCDCDECLGPGVPGRRTQPKVLRPRDKRVVLGIDPSETGCAFVAIPENWGRDFARVNAVTLELGCGPGATIEQRCKAIVRMAIDAVAWCRWVRVTHIWIEQPPAGPGAYNVERVLGVAHVLRHELFRELGVAAEWAPQSTARKLLLGKLPGKGRKEIVRRVVDSLHVFEDGDQADAFVAANWGVSQLGLPAFCGAEVAA